MPNQRYGNQNVGKLGPRLLIYQANLVAARLDYPDFGPIFLDNERASTSVNLEFTELQREETQVNNHKVRKRESTEYMERFGCNSFRCEIKYSESVLVTTFYIVKFLFCCLW